MVKSTKTYELDDREITRRNQIEDSLLGRCRFLLEDHEWKALSLLAGVLSESSRCRINGIGEIVADFDDLVEVALNVRETISASTGLKITPEGGFRGPRNLAVYVRRKASGSHSRDVCIVDNAAYNDETPALDKCVAFVLWAESGFQHPTETLSEAVYHCRDPVAYEKHLEDKERQRALLRERSRIRREERDRELSAERRLKSAIEHEEWRISQLSWRDLMRESESDRGQDSLGSAIARGLRNDLLEGVWE